MTTGESSGGAGPIDRPALRRCVTVPPAEFAASYWDHRPLLSPATLLPGNGFGDLLDANAVDELLSERGLRTPFLRVAKQGKVIPPSRYTGGGGAGAEVGDQVRDESVLGLLADGATLVLQGLHRLWPPVIAFAGQLRADTGTPVGINAYLTPPGNRGFAAHYDTHAVFVLQVEGHKHWRIHPPVFPEPLERQPWSDRDEEVRASAAGSPALDPVLGPGDALYLPRGWLHAADALDDRSLHLTIGLRAPTRYSIVDALLRLAAAEPALRTGLPMGVDLTDGAALGPALADTVRAVHAWLDKAEAEQVAEALRTAVWSASRPAPLRPVAQLAAIAGLRPSDHIIVRSGLAWRLEPAPDRLILRLPDRVVTFPAWCEPAVRAALRDTATRVADLPGLDDDSDRLVLARRLLREAIVVPGPTAS